MLSFALYFEVDSVDTGQFAMFLRIYIGDISPENKPTEIRVDIEMLKPDTLGVATPNIGLQVRSPTVLKIDAAFEDKKWVNLVARNIALNPNPATA